jgi:hypothetical protein
MIARRCSSVCVLFTIIAGSISHAAAANWPATTPDEVAITSVPQQPGAPAVVLYREDITDDTKNFRSVYVRLKVLTEGGRKYQDVEIPVGRKPFTLSHVSGRTVEPDGRVVDWEGQPVDKIALHPHGVRAHVKVFTLPAVQVGSILDYRYTLHFPEGSRNAPQWMVQSDLFQEKVVFKFVAAKYQPQTDSFRQGDTPGYVFIGSEHLEEVNGEYSWITHLPAGEQPEDHMTAPEEHKWLSLEMNDVLPVAPEPDLPPSEATNWRVDVFYRPPAKPENYWKNVAKAWDKNVEMFLDKKDGVLGAVTQLVGANDSEETKVRKIYDFISHLQNQSFSPDSFSAPSVGAEEVLRKRGGTHDELNRLFAAMLRAAGIPATLTWVPDRGRAGFDMNLMTTDQLDAEVSIVQLGGQDSFLDPGTRFCPLGLLTWHYEGTRGLRQSRNGSQALADTPAPTYKGAVTRRLARLQVNQNGTMEGQVAVGFSGQEAMVRRQLAEGMSGQGRKKLLEDEVASWFPAGTQVTLINSPQWDQTEGALNGQFKVSGPFAINNGRQWVVPVQVFEANEKPRFASAQRIGPIYFDYASRQVDEVHILLPVNIELQDLPSSRQAKTPYALYASEQKREGAGFVSTRDMAMNGVLFPPTSYQELKDFYDKVAEGDNETAALKGSLQ